MLTCQGAKDFFGGFHAEALRRKGKMRGGDFLIIDDTAIYGVVCY